MDAGFVYLPKLRDRVVLEAAIREAVAKLDPAFGYADGFDASISSYEGLVWAKAPPELLSPAAVIVRPEVVLERLRAREEVTSGAGGLAEAGQPTSGPTNSPALPGGGEIKPGEPRKPRRFYGVVDIDMVRPVKSFDQILNAVVMELQRTAGVKVKLTLEIEAEAPSGFSENDIGVVRDNARQLKFKPGSTEFGD